MGKETREPLDPAGIPAHVAIIMDGNGRWARKRGLPRTAGHREGMKSLKEIVQACGELGIAHLSVFAFSTENWKRPTDEVSFLMDLMIEVMTRELRELHDNGVRVRVWGDMSPLPEKTRTAILEGIRLTRDNRKMTLNIAFNYGSRQEILRAVRAILDAPPEDGQLSEEAFGEHLYSQGLPDPDLVIRTSGEYRLSNFMLWQAAYAEFYVTPKYWPDFRREDLWEALRSYQKRTRRYGGI